MTEEQLRNDFERLYKILRRELKMRKQVLKGENARVGVAEMELLLQIVTEWKQELKKYCEPAVEQGELLPLPRKVEYR